MKNKKIKILIAALKYFPASGGSASYAYNMAMGLHGLDYDILLLAPKYRHRKMDDDKFPFKVKRLRFIFSVDILRIPLAAVQILIHFVRFKPDVIWPTSFAGCRALGALTFLKTIFIGTIHGGGVHRRYPSRTITKKFADRLGLRFMNRADAIVTVSDNSKRIIANKIPYDNIIKKISIIYNSIDFDESRFHTKKQALNEFPEFKDKKIVLTVGRLVAAKGHDIVIKSIKLLKKKFPHILYIIVGEGVEKESLIKMIQDENLENNVFFAGYVSDQELEMYYAVCDIFVMAGRWTPEFVEGFGLVYIEAGLRGKAVIGTRVGGIPEAILEDKTGIIIEPENPAVLAEKIAYLFENKTNLEKMGKFASKYLKEHFSNDVMAKHNSDLIKGLLNKKTADV